uniref:Synapse defective Rho GTPase homolog 2 n=1 Tax=Oryzias sinensis TaxID=183150 RepID=A0A8C7WTS7_9TELE
MADPLRRTLLAKLRGKKSKKGATLGGGFGSAAAANGGHEGKAKVSRDSDEASGVVSLAGLDLSAERMSTYENCAEGATQPSGGVVVVPHSCAAELAASPPSSGGRVNKELPGVPLQRDALLGGEEVGSQPGFPHVPRKHSVSFPRQCRVGDSIGFGDNSNPVSLRAQVQPTDGKGGQPPVQVLALQEPSNQILEKDEPNSRNMEVLTPDLDNWGPTQTFFPTQLHICVSQEEPLQCPLGSEDEDYYDNENLPFYETPRPKLDGDRVEGSGPRQGRGQAESAQETDRLRNRLQEAYYLLINAMNDINLDVQQTNSGVAGRQAASSCSSRSRDSLCSRLSVKNIDSDSWSSGGDHSPQQVSDTDSLLLCLAGALESKGRLISKSVTNLSLTKRPTLLRCASDGAIGYQSGPPACAQTPGVQHAHDDQEEAETKKDDGVTQAGSSDSNSEAAPHPGQDGKQDSVQVRGRVCGSASKAHGVTVNKMQEWMHKGRLLSSEMKQRIEGSSLPHQDRLRPQAHPACCKPALQGGKSAKAKSLQQQPAFIENAQMAHANGRSTSELSPWKPQQISITVSKKRNWLQQSYQAKNFCTREDLHGMLGVEEEDSQGSLQPPPPPSLSPDGLRFSAIAPPRPVRLQLPQMDVSQKKVLPQCRSVDPTEENDADDEGEIWYNPIPEDDVPDISHRPSVRVLHPQDPHRKLSRGRDAVQVGRTLEGPSGSGQEVRVEGLGSSSGDVSQGNAAHSTQAPHPHRQMLVCKPQEEGGASASRPTECLDLPNVVGFSPPSSPNPTKKSSSINWSFPDKIKSPRTVRKISMKMKKLPELSRKLSVKGTQSSNNSSNGNIQLEPRAQSPRANSKVSEAFAQTSGPLRLASSGVGQASCNVISRYHLDSSVSTQNSYSKKKNNGSSKSASKGGYLSDGDSPELVAKSGKHGTAEGKGGRSKETEGGLGSSRLNGTELDIDAFRHYSFTEQPKCTQYISGLMSLHFYGAEDLKPPRIDSRDVYCAIQVDSVNKARTALLTCRTTFLDMDHTFNIELENAQHLKLVVFSWEPTPKRNRVCCHGTVVLPSIFRVTRFHQLAVKLEPRGLIYVKLSLIEHWQNSLDRGPDADREPQVFGVEAWRVVERENTGLMVPLIISKCIDEIEKRGCQVVGLYRLCGSAAVKKELREAFERDSHTVELNESVYPDINVITGVLKDYLRELPFPLINKPLYEAVLESMATKPLKMGAAGCENEQADSEHTVRLLEHLPEVERMTLRTLLNHLKRVASHQDVNKMTCQNLAVCFGPVLLSQRQEASCHTNRVFIDSEELASALHFKKHIEVLHYLLQLWPVVDALDPAVSAAPAVSDLLSAPPLRRRKERPQVLNLTEAEMAGVLRPKPGRLDSPSNRYAGDWSGCGERYFPSEMQLPPNKEEADYDDVPSEDVEEAEEVQEKQEDAVEEDQEENISKEPLQREEEVTKEEETVRGEENEEKEGEDEGSNKRQPLKEEEEQRLEERLYSHILPPRLPKEHAYQAYMKIQDISPVLNNRVNLRDLQESIDTLIGNLERELNKNKLNFGY